MKKISYDILLGIIITNDFCGKLSKTQYGDLLVYNKRAISGEIRPTERGWIFRED